MNAFLEMFMQRKEELLQLLLEHLEMTSLAVLLSLIVGVPIGLLITKSKKAASIVIGIANLMQSIPSIGLLAFMVPFVGIGEKPAIIMVVVYALLPIIKNTYTGITCIDPKMLEAARSIGLSKLQQLFQVQLPMAASFIMAGIRISAVTAVGTVTIAAFAGAGGLGWFINLGLNANDANLVLLGAIPACLLALLLDFILGKVEKAITPEGLKPADQIVYLPRSKRLARQVVAALLCVVILVVPAGLSVFQAMSKDQEKVVVGSMNFTESLILGYLYSDYIQSNTDIPVEEKFNLNGTMVAFGAMKSGDLDMFVTYTGVLAPNVLKLPMSTDTDAMYRDVKEGMQEEYRMGISNPLGFSNTYVLSVTPQVAEQYGIENLSDLIANAPSLRFGCTSAFSQREDLLPKLQKEWHVQFKEVTGIEGNIRYQAASNGEVDVIDAFETDAMLKKNQMVQLKDDLNFFPPYQAVNVYQEKIIEQFPELKPLLERLDGAITTEDMMNMNYQVDVDGLTPETVAHEFLLKKGLIPAE